MSFNEPGLECLFSVADPADGRRLWTDPEPRDSSRIRVLYVIGTLDIGGAESQLVQLASQLSRRGFAPAVCCLSSVGPLAADLEQAGVPVVTVGFRGAKQKRGLARVRAAAAVPLAMWRLVRLVKEARVTIIHGFLFHGYVLAAAVGWLLRVPVVVASRRSLSLFKTGRLSYRLAERVTNRWTDAIIANSEAVRQDAIRTERLSPTDVLVIHNGLDPARYSNSPDEALRRQLGLNGRPVAIVVANFIHYKGHRWFLDAWASVLRTCPSATALLVGDGPERGAAEIRAAELGLGEGVQFLGSRRDVPQLLALADVFVHPSLEEGFSNAVLEAMASACPVVVTNVGGTPEAVIDGKTGWVVPPRDAMALADAMVRVLAAPDRGRAMGKAGQRRVHERFTQTVMTEQYRSVYLDLVAKANR